MFTWIFEAFRVQNDCTSVVTAAIQTIFLQYSTARYAIEIEYIYLSDLARYLHSLGIANRVRRWRSRTSQELVFQVNEIFRTPVPESAKKTNVRTKSTKTENSANGHET